MAFRRWTLSPQALYCFFLVTLLLPNLILSFTEELSPVEMGVNILLPLGLYGLLTSLSRNLGRSIWIFFPLVFLAAFQIVLLGLYGRSIIAVDMFLNLTTTNTEEAGELLGSIWPDVALVCVLYIPSLVMGTVMMVRHVGLPAVFVRRSRMFATAACGCGVLCLAITGLTDRAWSMSDDLYPVNVAYNISLAARHNAKVSRHERMAGRFRFGTVSERPDSLRQVYVLVVGETSRADHWHIGGYARNTTPGLSRRRDILFFDRAMSESNTTHKSVPLLLSHLSASEYGDSIYSVKSVLTAFAEAGYSTAFLSNQRRNGSFIEFFGDEAGTTVYLREKDGPGRPDASDLELLPLVREVLARRSPHQLIVLHTYGSHFSYRDRYPRSEARFLPDDYESATPAERDRLVNAYDNTVALTDKLLDALIRELEGCGADVAGLLYTADHGEDIFDDSRNLFTHASPCPSYYQLHVPMLAWMSEGYRRMFPDKWNSLYMNLDKRVATSESFFDTAMGMAGLSTPRSSLKSDLTDRAYREAPRVYLDDRNRAVPLDMSGFTAPDFALLRSMDSGRALRLMAGGM